MTSNSFKSAYPGRSNQSLGIVRADNRVRVSVDHGSDGARGIIIAPSDAPALALAILEAAGYGEEIVTDGSPDGHIQVAKYYLYEGVKAHASITAEARERAELEAEALELFRAFQHVRADGVFVSVPSFASLSEPQQAEWLAVARRARELAKEATK